MGNCFASDTDSPHAGLAITTDLLSSPAKGSPDSSPGIEVPDVNVDNGKDEIYYDAEHEQPEPSQVSTPSAADFEAFNGGWHQVRTENMNNFLAEMQVPWCVSPRQLKGVPIVKHENQHHTRLSIAPANFALTQPSQVREENDLQSKAVPDNTVHN